MEGKLLMSTKRRAVPRRLAGLALAVGLGLIPLTLSSGASAATSTGCEGGGFSVTTGGATFAGTVDQDIAVGPSIQVRGRYAEFDIVPATFGITNYVLTGAPNPEDLTGGQRTPLFAAKTPDHRGLSLTGPASLRLSGTDILISRTGPGLSMKLTAKDCATGGTFQMEPERADGTRTRITHVLADGIFYFDNPNFRAREGDVVPFKDTTIVVTPRINFAGDVSPKLVGRDSPQVATRVLQGCPNQITKRDGTQVTVDHCGGVSVWDVASGGRMGQVHGEDATEVAPPATNCTQNCQARNRVRGRAVVLGFPFPVPAASRLTPRFPTV
jgi:hypothetical protein